MNAEDLAKFNPGDKVRMTIETTLGDYAPSGSHVPVRLGVEHDVQTHIRADAIVSIERVRPELPGRWEYGGRTGNAILREDEQETGGHCIIAEVSASQGLHTYCAVKLNSDEVIAVIEAVRATSGLNPTPIQPKNDT